MKNMDNIVKGFYKIAKSIPFSEEKALAYYMVREILEDLHTEGKISDEEMCEINKTAVNRAYIYLKATKNEDAYKGFIMNAAFCKEWDDPDKETGDYDSWLEMGKSIKD